MEDVGFLQPGHGLAAAARVRLRQHAVHAVPHRRVHVHPRLRAGRDGQRIIDVEGPARRRDRAAEHAAQLRDPRPRRVGRQRDPRQAGGRRRRGGRCCSSTAPTRPPATPMGRRAPSGHARSVTRSAARTEVESDTWGTRGRSVQAESTVRAVGSATAARAVRRRGVGATRRQLQVGRDEAVRGARRLGRHRARARRQDAPRHPLLPPRLARRAVAQALARAARDEPRPAHPAGQRGDGSLRRGDDRAGGRRA